MTNRETEILDMIKKNPLISQQEMANILGITRSSVAVHITNLMKKGHIRGKGYILNKKDYVVVIGGANIDITGFPNGELVLSDSNPGKVKMSLGGVGRNIAENLVKMDITTKLITVVGDDIYGNKILDECKLIGIDVDNSMVLKGTSSSTYLSILNEKGDMSVAIAHMDIFDKINIDFIKEKSHIIENAKVVIIDTNLPKDVIEYILTTHKETDFFLDTVSTKKAQKITNLIGYFHTIKPNKIEAEMLLGMEISNLDDLKVAAKKFLNLGVQRIFISLGEKGVFYADNNTSNLIHSPNIEVINATGAGDAFIAGLAYSYINEYNIEKSGKFAMTAAILALSHENTINPNISYENIEKKMEEIDVC